MAETSEYYGQIPFFLELFLSKFETAIPKGAQWVLFFESLDSVTDVILNTIKIREPRAWNIQDLAEKIAKNPVLQTEKGCLFAQAVEIPGESTIANPEGIQMNGFLRATAGGGRGDYSSGIRISFLETNYSFVDTVIRPWVITTGHLGFIARSKPEEQYRCNIHVCKLGVTAGRHYTNNDVSGSTPYPRTPSGAINWKEAELVEGSPPVVLQKYTFYNACPVQVSSEEYNYSPVSAPTNRDTTFIYDYYTIDGGENS